MDYDEINLKIVIKNTIYSIPCNIAISEDKDKLLIILKQGKVGTINEIRNLLIEEGKPQQ